MGTFYKKIIYTRIIWMSVVRKGRKIKEVRFDGTQLWPDGPKNK